MSRVWPKPKKRPKNGERRRRKRAHLHRRQGGRCYWCGCLTILIENNDPGNQPDDLATLDHLDDRFSPERGKRSGEWRIVMACRLCNNERGIIREAMQPVEELRRRSTRHGGAARV